jgi:flagellar L-ring protein precursor FlgH
MPIQGQQPPLSPGAAVQRANGSLLQASLTQPPTLNTVSFFAVPEQQPKTLKKHDLVTIIVREESESKSEGTSDLKKSADLEAKLEEWIKLSVKNLEIQGGAQGPIPPSIKASGKRDFKGEATVDRTDSLTLRVTAEVVDVKPNNTLVLQARQTIKTDDEVQTLILSGICRVEDITSDNSILSTQMFDKEVTKTHTGAVRDTTKRGLVPKLLDALNPF